MLLKKGAVMLRSIKKLHGYIIQATDGKIGEVHEFYFDDDRWTIRYLIVDTGTWLPGRHVLVSPSAIQDADWVVPKLKVNLTQAQIRESPEVEVYKPFSRQQELNYVKYYGWPTYWSAAIPTTNPKPAEQSETTSQSGSPNIPSAVTDDAPHLRQTREVIGYHIHANDGDIGHVEDFIFDDKTWIIRYMVIDTRNWLPGKKVLVSPEWITDIDGEESKVSVNLSQAEVRNSPAFDPSAPVNREYETRLYDYYGRPTYW
jgi:uncharacterized protein YrrD